MRTRFLTDFFNSSAASQSLQTLDFLRFPPPQLTSPDIFNFDNLSCFDQVTSLNISPEVERFSVNESLSKFFSDVLPQHIHVEIDQQIARAVTSEEKIDDYFDDADNTISTLVEFETPELHLFLKDSSFLHEEKMQIFFEVADEKVNLDLNDFSHEVQKLVDIQKSIFLVEDYDVNFQEEQKSDFFDNNSLLQAQISSSNLRTFPLLEIDETSLGIKSFISEEKHIIFESNEPQQWMQKDESEFDLNKQILSIEFNILEHILNHPPVPCHQLEVPCVNFSPDNIINAIEDCEQIFSEYLQFEPLKFFDTNTSHFSQVFSDIETISEVEQCEQMFNDTTSTTFNSLIVKHELVLRDDSFKSLPVPIISDHEKILSIQEIVEEILLKLKIQPSSSSDDIYLDWHLLEEDISSHNMKMFEDIETYSVDTDMKSCDSQMSILEFVLFDACLNEKKCEEEIEVLKVEMSGNLMDSVCNNGIGSSELNDKWKKMESGEGLGENKGNRTHQVVESMSEINDLDFFLNSLEGSFVKKQKDTDKKLEMDYAIPVVPANLPIETCETSKKQQQSLEIEFYPEGDYYSTSISNESNKISKGLSHSTPVEQKNIMGSLETTNEVTTTSFHLQIPKLPSPTDPTKTNTNSHSSPDSIIIVNTQNVDTEMIISRRTTYQRILSMEKHGLQVVERDLNLPIDLILTASLCLLFYDIKNIRTKSTSSDINSSSFIPSCVENIADILTSLSFAFNGCILIFEGEVGFLGGIMESSDELYAAASSLGLDLQLFYSYSTETTDEIIVNSITHSTKSTKGLYPKMPESETLAESFLSKFPSINPLSAHAILSSGSLLEFLEMPHQQRVCTLKKYLVPEASIILFTALCKFGEREDSRSGMTDCCSSVSSGHDSGNFRPKSDHESKKRKYIPMSMDHSFQFGKINDVTWDTPKINIDFDEMYLRSEINMTSFGQNKFGSQLNCNHKGLQEGYKGQVVDISDDDDVAGGEFSFGKTVSFPIETRSVTDNYGSGKRVSYDWCSLPSFPTAAEITLNSKPELTDNVSPFEMSSQECSIVNSPMNYHRLEFKEMGQGSNSWTPFSKAISSGQSQKRSPWTIDFLKKGQVVDMSDDDDVADGEFSFGKTVSFPIETRSVTDNYGSGKRVSYDWCSLPSFPTAAEITLNSKPDLMDCGTPFEMSSQECSIVNSPMNYHRLDFKEMGQGSNGGTPFSKAISSGQSQKGSPWTIDFLNKIKEKSRIRQQILAGISSAPCFGNSSKCRKRKSPSILDFYKYKRNSSNMENIEHKEKSNSSKGVKSLPSLSQTWTPIDKRAKRKLTFATDGSKGQSKLIWSDKTDQTLNRRT